MARTSSARDIDTLARQWWQRHPNDPRLRFGKAVVADSVESLVRTLDLVSSEKHEQGMPVHPWLSNRLAFVYPGLGNQFAGMGRALSALWPDVLDRAGLGKRLSERTARSPRLVERRTAPRVRRPSSPDPGQCVGRRPRDRRASRPRCVVPTRRSATAWENPRPWSP